MIRTDDRDCRSAVVDELMVLEARKRELKQRIASAPEPMPRLHPNLSELYRQKVASLHEALNAEDTRSEAAEALRGLCQTNAN
jgi:site-specific DNA recombinase